MYAKLPDPLSLGDWRVWLARLVTIRDCMRIIFYYNILHDYWTRHQILSLVPRPLPRFQCLIHAKKTWYAISRERLRESRENLIACGRAKSQQFWECSDSSEVRGKALNRAADCSTIIELAFNVLTNLPFKFCSWERAASRSNLAFCSCGMTHDDAVHVRSRKHWKRGSGLGTRLR